jgi:hypothetical protein
MKELTRFKPTRSHPAARMMDHRIQTYPIILHIYNLKLLFC